MSPHQPKHLTEFARDLRKFQTESESLLWQSLRARRLCGLKFRRQFPIPPYIADFACLEQKLVVEIDGGYHDCTYENDLARQTAIESQGWQVLRFSSEDVMEDVEAIAIAIARFLGKESEIKWRDII